MVISASPDTRCEPWHERDLLPIRVLVGYARLLWVRKSRTHIVCQLLLIVYRALYIFSMESLQKLETDLQRYKYLI